MHYPAFLAWIHHRHLIACYSLLRNSYKPCPTHLTESDLPFLKQRELNSPPVSLTHIPRSWQASTNKILAFKTNIHTTYSAQPQPPTRPLQHNWPTMTLSTSPSQPQPQPHLLPIPASHLPGLSNVYPPKHTHTLSSPSPLPARTLYIRSRSRSRMEIR